MRALLLSTILLLVMCSTLIGQTETSNGSVIQAITPITLPQLNDPFLGPTALAGVSGFFWTRSATELGTLAMEKVPILEKEIVDLKALGLENAKKVDSAKAWNGFFTAMLIVLPVVTFLGDELYHATHK